MPRAFLILLFSIVISHRLLSQPIPFGKAQAWLKQLVVSRPDSNRVICLLDLAAYYQLKPGEDKTDIDSAFLLTDQANLLASSIGFRRGTEIAAYQRCRTTVEINDTLATNALFPALSDSNKVKVLLDWGTHYLFTNSVHWKKKINDLCRQSLHISAASTDSRMKCNSNELLALYYLAFKKLEKGRTYAQHCFEFLDSTGDCVSADELCNRVSALAGSYPFDSLSEFAYEYRAKMAIRTGDYQKAANIYKSGQYAADDRRENGKSILFGIKALQLADHYRDTTLFKLYILIMQSYFYNGDLYHVLSYGHKALDLVIPGKSPNETYYWAYYQLAEVSQQMDRFDQCIDFCKKGIAEADRCLTLPSRTPNLIRDAYMYRTALARDEALSLCQEGNARQGLDLMEEFERRFGNYEINMSMLQLTKAESYCFLKEYDQAEKCFAASLDSRSKPSANDSLRALLPLARLFMDKGDSKKATESLQKLLHARSYIVSPFRIRDTYFLLYQADSARGNFRMASKYLRQYEGLSDSLFTVAKNGQIEAQQLEFATEAKDHTMKMQAQHILLLQNEEQLQRAQLRAAHLLRNMVITGSVLLILLLGVVYNRYRLKRRSTAMLQRVIEEKEDLLAEKDDLLVEKEWLIKEVHHRVKNNLQIVVSLLDMASRYIDNEAAASAIRESQHRMHAMSLIHQKLYKTDGAELVEMDDYIHDLVSYLDSNYNVTRRIHFALELARIRLDASIAVPIGLLLNEAITNTIKHAFPGDDRGTIYVGMSAIESSILLTIRDNGIGLPRDFEENKKRSMGISLMKALGRQVHGTFDLVSQGGVTIEVRFPKEL